MSTHNWKGHQIDLRRTPGGYEARATVHTRFGAATVAATVPLALVLAASSALAAPGVTSGADFGELGTGFDFGDITKALGTAVKSKEFGQVTGVVSAVAKNPALQGLASVALGPEAGMALQGVGAAADAASVLAASARKRDPKAVKAIKQIGDRARRGDKRAAGMAALVAKAIDLHAQAENEGAAVTPPPAPLFSLPTFPYAAPVADGPYDQMAARYQRPAETMTLLPDGSYGVLSASSGCF